MSSNGPTTQDTRPRLLCLHGGGVTGEIFALQLRALKAKLPQFRLAFADGPFFCAPGPGMLPVYAGYGPYRRWLRWIADQHAEIDDEVAIEEIEYAMASAMEDDDVKGGRGEWMGLVGFSQGAKVAVSVLYESELRLREVRGSDGPVGARSQPLDGMYGGLDEDDEPLQLDDMPAGIAGGRWRFAICLAGRAPLVQLSRRSAQSTTMVSAGGISDGGLEFDVDDNKDKISLPTLHVHGLSDPGLHLHRRLTAYYCERESAQVVEWDGAHRVAFKKTDTQKIADGVLSTARRAGVLPPESRQAYQ